LLLQAIPLTTPSTVHIPVLPEEVIDSMQPAPGHIVVDGTLGGAGHTLRLLAKVGESGRVIAFDRDPGPVEEASEKIDDPRLTLIHANYADIPEHLHALGIDHVDSILLDLGLSSDQLEDRDRGFSYQSDGTLDLRFNPLAGEAAWKLVNRLSEKHLADLIYQFGEERLSRRIARKIVAARQDAPIRTSIELAQLVRRCVPRSKNHSIDPATRTFQALRIAVNEELKWLSVAMERLPKVLAVGGRISVISFHSLEDRIVKHALAQPAMNAGFDLKVLTRKPIMASPEELDSNPRSRSAKMRVAERVA
jgi:16S rRNA (cytosine1402-N4)-methyltransferase